MDDIKERLVTVEERVKSNTKKLDEVGKNRKYT